SSASRICASALRAAGWADLGRQSRLLATLWTQSRCAFVSGNTSRSAGQNPSAPSLAVTQQARPGLGGLAVPIGERDQFLLPVGADPDDHQGADPVLVEAHPEVDAISPHIHVIRAG